MSKKSKRNYFDLHDNYESIEELELELSKVSAKCMELQETIAKTKLPPVFVYGILRGVESAYDNKVNDTFENVAVSALLEAILGADDD